jgi:predicted hotdog family 3-hydroxylacyl-ACP dehydratase
MIDRAAIAELIPHTGAMCLLDVISEWDDASITGHSSTHHDPANPMRVRGWLDILCGVEYAAQVIAVHGGLLAGGASPGAGYLASLRDLTCHADRLDEMPGSLVIRARRLLAESGRAIYMFEIEAEGRQMLQGRAALVLDGGAPR